MFNYFNYVIENLSTTFKYYKALIELNKLSDKELKYLGLTRAEIPTAVYKSMLE